MVRKITLFKSPLMLLWLLLASLPALAQTPTVTGYSPTKITQRYPVSITGTGFTGVSQVRFNGVAATSFTVVSNTSITAVVPLVTGVTSGTTSTLAVTITKNNITTTAPSNGSVFLQYVAPVGTPANAGVTRIITDFNGYWSSSAVTTVPANQPNTNHSLMAFGYDGRLYSTGSDETVTSVLGGSNAATTGAYRTANFSSLPINTIAGNVGSSSSVDPNLIVLASNIDGNPNAQVASSQYVAGLTVRDVLIDGVRGLGIGTGVTNLPSSSILSFRATNILSNVANDSIPDIVVSQVASPTNNSFDVYCFVDSRGNIVGKPVQINLFNISAVGTYKTDFFTLPGGAPLTTATVNGTATPGGNTRDIRLVAYKLSDFDINETNRTQAVQFKVMPSGTSDPAFIAYNKSSFNIAAPVIATQPVSVNACPGTAVSFAVTLATNDTNNVFRWEKNGVELTDGNGISGSHTATLSLSSITANSAGAYRVVVSNIAGAAVSQYAYLNNAILSSAGASACEGTNGALEVFAQGTNPSYQWYKVTESNPQGELIAGATNATYTPSNVGFNTPTYYFAEVFPPGFECAKLRTPNLEYTVNKPIAGTAASSETSVCAGTNVQLTVQNHVGNIQWMQSTDGGATWVNVVGGLGGNTATYSTNPLSVTTRYKAVSKIDGCPNVAESEIVTVNVNETTYWTGTQDNFWNTPGNWSCGTVPNIYTNVVIPTAAVNQPTVSGLVANAKSVTVQSGARLTVATAGTINVVNAVNVANSGVFVVENNGSLVQDTAAANTGSITVKRDSNSLYRLDYTLWSSPVSGQNLLDFSPLTITSRFYEYKFALSTETGEFREQYLTVNPAVTNFDTAKGYLIRMPNQDAATGYNDNNGSTVFHGSFTGVPHNGTITYPLSTSGNRYTAVGNPYPSPISVADFFSQNENVLDNTSALYFWRKKNNAAVSSYATLTLAAFTANTARTTAGNEPTPNYTSGGQPQGVFFEPGNNALWRIAQGQGFFVRTKSTLTGTPVVSFSNAMRREAPQTGTQAIFRTGENTTSRLWLNLTSGTDAFSQIAIAYIDGATNGLDYGYDGLQFTDDVSLALYTVAENTNLAIQARPLFNSSDIVPMGYVAGNAGSYTIELDHVDGTFETTDQDILLKDNTTGVTVSIKDAPYTFTTEAGSFSNRFEVVYTTQALGNNNPELTANDVIVYKEGEAINITSSTATITGVTVFDVRGRQLYTKSGVNANQTVVSGLQAAQQVLIVEIETTKGKTSRKIVF